MCPTDKPTSQARIEVNRINAQKSTGPKSEAGKARISLNALRHGLTGRVTAMNEADREAHDRHMTEHMKSFHPETPLERDLAEAIAEDLWRLKNARAMEQNIFANSQIEAEPTDLPLQLAAALTDAETFLNDAPKFQLLTLYQQRIERSVHKNLALLKEQQAERKAVRDKAFAEAQTLAQLSYAEGKAWQPETEPRPANGFVFSSDEINREIRRKRRLHEGKVCSVQGWDLKNRPRREYLSLIDASPEALPLAA